MGRIFKSAEIGVRQTAQGVHRHMWAELYASLGGRTTDVVNGCEIDTLPLDVFVLTSDMSHGQINTDDYRYCILKFDFDALLSYLGEFSRERGFQSLFVIGPSLRGEGEEMANMCIDANTAKYVGICTEMLASLGECATSDALFVSLVMLLSERARAREVGIRDTVAEAVFYMNLHYNEEISLGTIASTSGYSARHLTRLFRKYFDVSPMQYLLNLRMEKAAELLSDAALTVTEIAASVGMTDPCAFTKSFRKKFGATPTEYRRRIRGL